MLDKAVAKGRHGRVVFAFALNVPLRIDRYGSAGGYSYLGNALPVLALHDSAGWHLDRYTPNGEAYYTTVADFTVRLDHPSDVSVPATGVSTDKAAGPGRTLTTSVAHHVRDFAWAVGPYRRVTGGDGNGVRVNVWWNPDTVTASQANHALRLAKRTMAHDAKAFGAYPYRESDVVLDGFTSFGGMEYPGFVLSVPDDEAIAHEITHNWWYGIVGNDEYRAPWLDESFTEYVTCASSAGRSAAATCRRTPRPIASPGAWTSGTSTRSRTAMSSMAMGLARWRTWRSGSVPRTWLTCCARMRWRTATASPRRAPSKWRRSTRRTASAYR